MTFFKCSVPLITAVPRVFEGGRAVKYPKTLPRLKFENEIEYKHPWTYIKLSQNVEINRFSV